MNRLASGAAAVAPAVVALVVLVLASVAGSDWYGTLLVPSFDPPPWLSIPLWGMADLLMAYGFFRVLRRPDWMPDRPRAIRAFAVEAGVVILWPLAFFIVRSPTAGLVVMLALLAAVVTTGRLAAAVDRKAGLLVLLCAVWVSFTTLLMISIVIRN